MSVGSPSVTATLDTKKLSCSRVGGPVSSAGPDVALQRAGTVGQNK